MTFSLGEVEALSRKAARGAGLSWGMAEEAGKTVRSLCHWGLPGAHALARYLSNTKHTSGPTDPTAPVWSTSGLLCPLICNALMSDMGTATPCKRIERLGWPILLVPFGACSIRLAWGETEVNWDGTLHIAGDCLTPFADVVTITHGTFPVGRPCVKSWRAEITEQDFTTLSRLAAHTYAPETEASKRTGAGAGLTDKD